MIHDELLDKIEDIEYWQEHYAGKTFIKAIRAVVELHKPLKLNNVTHCPECQYGSAAGTYPCPTIQVIEKELNG